MKRRGPRVSIPSSGDTSKLVICELDAAVPTCAESSEHTMHRLVLFFDFEHAARDAGATDSSALFQNGGHVYDDGVAVDFPVYGPSFIFLAGNAEVFVLRRRAGREAGGDLDRLFHEGNIRRAVELSKHSLVEEGNQVAHLVLLNGVSGKPRVAKGVEAACRGLDPRAKVTRHFGVRRATRAGVDVHAALGTLLEVGSFNAVAFLIKLQFAVEVDATETCNE